MVKRVVGAILLMLSIFVAAPVRADVGQASHALVDTQDQWTGPAEAAGQSLVEKYPPDHLHFYTDGASWYEPRKAFRNGMNQVVEAFFQSMAIFATVVIKTVEHAWNLNLARGFGTIIDAVANRFTNLVWSFASVLFTLTAAWILVQVAKGNLSRILGHVAVLMIVLSLVIATRGGVAKSVALVEDAGSEVSARILGTSSATSTTQQAAITSMTDAIYKQLILEPWARGNFSSIEVAADKKYSAGGIPGGQFLGLSDADAQAKFKENKGEKNPDLSPWYDEGSVGLRIGVVLNAFLSMVLFLPILGLLAAVVLGFKGFTVFFAMGIPVALFLAAMPWSRGLGFLRWYAGAVCVSAFVKMAMSVVLAFYIAFLQGMIDSAHKITGGWLTVTLVMASMALTMLLLLRWPFRRGRAEVRMRKPRAPKPPAERQAAPAGESRKRPRVVPNDRNIRWAKTKTGRRLQVLRPGQQPVGPTRPASTTTAPKSPHVRRRGRNSGGDRLSHRRWIFEQYLNSRHGSGGHSGKGGFMPDIHAADLMREAKRVVRAMARAAENLGGRR